MIDRFYEFEVYNNCIWLKKDIYCLNFMNKQEETVILEKYLLFKNMVMKIKKLLILE